MCISYYLLISYQLSYGVTGKFASMWLEVMSYVYFITLLSLHLFGINLVVWEACNCRHAWYIESEMPIGTSWLLYATSREICFVLDCSMQLLDIIYLLFTVISVIVAALDDCRLTRIYIGYLRFAALLFNPAWGWQYKQVCFSKFFVWC